jgi:hypothetical protein
LKSIHLLQPKHQTRLSASKWAVISIQHVNDKIMLKYNEGSDLKTVTLGYLV